MSERIKTLATIKSGDPERPWRVAIGYGEGRIWFYDTPSDGWRPTEYWAESEAEATVMVGNLYADPLPWDLVWEGV